MLVVVPNESATAGQLREERRVTLFGLVVNLFLATGKVLVGLAAGSSAIIADGLHSASDLASDFVVLWGIAAAKRPADADHHYGHSRYESIITLFVGLLLVAAALFVGIESIVSLGRKHGAIRGWLPFWAAVVSIVFKESLYWWTRAVGRRYGNPAVLANAWHHRSDAFSSVAAAVGIAGALVGGDRWAFLDHVTAVVLAAFLVIIGIRVVRESLQKLSDRAPAPADVERMRAAVAAIPGVLGLHAFRARHSGAGGMIEMDVHVEVDPALTVRQGHDIASQVESQLRNEMPDITGIVVHVEPAAVSEETAADR